MDFVNKLPFARDRIVECYFWAYGVYFEPQYHFGRKTWCKVCGSLMAFMCVWHIGTPEELELFIYQKKKKIELFTEVVERFKIVTRAISFIKYLIFS